METHPVVLMCRLTLWRYCSRIGHRCTRKVLAVAGAKNWRHCLDAIWLLQFFWGTLSGSWLQSNACPSCLVAVRNVFAAR